MNQKLVVLAHGIGDNAAGFSKNWEKILRKNHPKAKFKTAEFVWEDILEEAEKQYPLIFVTSGKLGSIAARSGS